MKKTYVSFLWHFHQPYYKESVDGDFRMAWVRLHGVKDYISMATLMQEFPKMKATFNFTPSLIAQFNDYIDGTSEDFIQKICKKEITDLTYEEKCFILDKCFQANWNTLIKAYPRFEQLYKKRRITVKKAEEIHNLFTDRDVHDLRVLFNLAWIHQTEIDKDPFLKELQKKGERFSQSDLNTLMEKHKEILSKIMPLYKSMAENQQAELITSPFYHPILPLLFNMESSLEGMPNNPLPRRTEELTQDGITQITRGIELFRDTFGFSPNGMWPSEGSVSMDIIPTLAQNGIKWIATDEEILGNSLKRNIKDLNERPKLLYKPYKIEANGSEIDIIFRDLYLADLIGFKYQSWNSDAAAQDFVNKLAEIGTHAPDNALINVILDGENAWEYYSNNAIDFFRSLYSTITKSKSIVPTTVSEYLNKFPSKNTITKLFPGSWINHNFYIWVGHKEDVKAWEYLFKARDVLKRVTETEKDTIDKNKLEKAWEELYIAEGSDWFWWYGDDHSSGEDEVYDMLFREHLKNIFRYLDKPVPDYLSIPVISEGISTPFTSPKEFLVVKYDGRDSNYFEWIGAGKFNVKSEKGAMDSDAELIMEKIFFGFDLNNFFLRINMVDDVKDILDKNKRIVVHFLSPKTVTVEISRNSKNKFHASLNGTALDSIAVNKILEFGIGFDKLGFSQREVVQFYVELFEGKHPKERAPSGVPLSFEVPDEEFEMKYWNV